MFALFYSLYLAMFSGNWQNFTWADLFGQNQTRNVLQSCFNSIGKLLTNIFNDSGNYSTFGNEIYDYIPELVSFVLALITSIGIVVMAVKGVKKAFGIFFMGIRR